MKRFSNAFLILGLLLTLQSVFCTTSFAEGEEGDQENTKKEEVKKNESPEISLVRELSPDIIRHKILPLLSGEDRVNFACASRELFNTVVKNPTSSRLLDLPYAANLLGCNNDTIEELKLILNHDPELILLSKSPFHPLYNIIICGNLKSFQYLEQHHPKALTKALAQIKDDKYLAHSALVHDWDNGRQKKMPLLRELARYAPEFFLSSSFFGLKPSEALLQIRRWFYDPEHFSYELEVIARSSLAEKKRCEQSKRGSCSRALEKLSGWIYK